MMRPARHEPWCVVAIVVRDALYTSRIPEALIDLATAHGWHVIARDSDILAEPRPTERRTGEDR